MKPATVEWDAAALDRHFQWAFRLAVEVDVDSAETYLHRIDAVVARVGKFPEGHPETGTRPQRRMAVETERGYQVVYDYEPSRRHVLVVAVVKGPPIPV